MRDQFIPYMLALKLEKLGFNEICLTYYNYNGRIELSDDWAYGVDMGDKRERNQCLAPLWQQAFDWFRIVHGYLPKISNCSSTSIPNFEYSAEDYLKSDDDLTKKSILATAGFKTYEEAREACLLQLIKSVTILKEDK